MKCTPLTPYQPFWIIHFGIGISRATLVPLESNLYYRAASLPLLVMPRGFHGVQVKSGPDVYIPLIAAERLFNDPDRNSYRKLGYTLLARLRLGVTLAAARGEAESIFKAA